MDIFISYSSQDYNHAKDLIEVFESDGHNIWIDKKEIVGGANWAGEIAKAIKKCMAFILLITPNSTKSVNVLREVYLASKYDKEVLPIVIMQTQLSHDLDYLLAGIQYFDFDKNYSQEIERLRSYLLSSKDHSLEVRARVLQDYFGKLHIYDQYSPGSQNKKFVLHYNSYFTFANLLNELWFLLKEYKPPAYTYGEKWILADLQTDQHFVADNGGFDERSLEDVGILPGMELVIKPYSNKK